MADRMWGEKNTTRVDVVGVMQRQVHFAEYLTARGVPAGHNTGRWCEVFADRCFAYPDAAMNEEPLQLDPRRSA
jgi:hypothetical protein